MAVLSIFAQAAPAASLQTNASQFNFAMEFEVSSTAAITGVWWYTAPGSATIPTDSGVWLVGGGGTQVVHHSSPSWSAGAGSGWIKDTYDGSVNVTAGNKYLVAVAGGGVGNWFTEDNTGASAWNSGRSNGILSAPSSSAADHGQDPFVAAGAWTYPSSAPANGFNFNVDIEVTTSSGPVITRVNPDSWWQLDSALKERQAYYDYYRSIPPVACPNDGEPLLPGPPSQPGILYCRFDGWQYPRDYDVDLHQGM